MCQFCNLTRLSQRVSPLGAPSRSLSSWGQLARSQPQNVGRREALGSSSLRHSSSLTETVLRRPLNPPL